MAIQVTDEETQLKRQARRRLIGAVAITTAVAVILPMVLDSEPKPAGVNIELVIPDKNAAPAFQPKPGLVTVPTEMPAASAVVSTPPVAAVSAVPLVAAPAPVAAKPTPSPAVAVVPAKPETSPLVKTESKSGAVPATVVAPANKPSEPAKPAEATKQTEATPAASKPSSAVKLDTEVKSAPPKSSGALFLQVGVFSNPDNARELAAKLKKLGFSVISENTGTRTKVRVGPYANRDAVDKAKHKLDAQGVNSALVDTGKHP